jgi:hypothetical protein
MPPLRIGPTVAFASALVTNTAYSLEHTVAWLQWREPADLLVGRRP